MKKSNLCFQLVACSLILGEFFPYPKHTNDVIKSMLCGCCYCFVAYTHELHSIILILYLTIINNFTTRGAGMPCFSVSFLAMALLRSGDVISRALWRGVDRYRSVFCLWCALIYIGPYGEQWYYFSLVIKWCVRRSLRAVQCAIQAPITWRDGICSMRLNEKLVLGLLCLYWLFYKLQCYAYFTFK